MDQGQRNQVRLSEDEPQPLLPLLRKHAAKGVLPCLIVAAAVLGGSLWWPRSYDAEAIFEIRQKLSMQEVLGHKLIGQTPDIKQTLVQDLSGRMAVEQVIDDLNLIPQPRIAGESPDTATARYQAQRRMLAQQLAPAIRVHMDLATPDLQRIRVVVQSDNAAHARDIANRLVENYIKQGHRQAVATITERERFLEEQAERYSEELAAAVQTLTAFEVENPSPAVASPARWQELHVQGAWAAMTAQTRYDAAKQRVDELTAELGPDAAKVAPAAAPLVDKAERIHLEKLLYTCRDELGAALTLHHLGDEHRKVIALRDRIAQIEQRLQSLPASAGATAAAGHVDPATALAAARAELTAAGEALRLANEHAATLKDESVRLAPIVQEHRKLKREVEAVQAHLGFWENHLLEAGRSLGEEYVRHQGSMLFLSPAAEMLLPSSPGRREVITVALLCGLAAGAMVIYLAIQKDHSYRLMEHVEQDLPIPVLGELGLDDRQPLASRMWQLGVWRPVGAGVVAIIVALLLNMNMSRLGKPGEPTAPRQNNPLTQELEPANQTAAADREAPPRGM